MAQDTMRGRMDDMKSRGVISPETHGHVTGMMDNGPPQGGTPGRSSFQKAHGISAKPDPMPEQPKK